MLQGLVVREKGLGKVEHIAAKRDELAKVVVELEARLKELMSKLEESVSRYLRLTFVLKSVMKFISFPQFMVLFVGLYIFLFRIISLSRYSQYCELMWFNFSFRLKDEEEEGRSSWCLAKRIA